MGAWYRSWPKISSMSLHSDTSDSLLLPYRPVGDGHFEQVQQANESGGLWTFR